MPEHPLLSLRLLSLSLQIWSWAVTQQGSKPGVGHITCAAYPDVPKQMGEVALPRCCPPSCGPGGANVEPSVLVVNC